MMQLAASYVFFCAFYSILALSAAVLIRCGVLSLAHSAMAAVGAYASISIWLYSNSAPVVPGLGSVVLGFIAAFLAGAVVAIVLGILVVRIEGDAVLVATLLFVEACRRLIEMSDHLGGSVGVAVRSLPDIDASTRSWLIGAVACAGLLFLVSAFLYLCRSGVGSILDTIRHNAEIAEAAGFNVRKIRYVLFVVCGIVAAMAGSLYALFTQYVAPSAFGWDSAILIFVMALVGEKKSAWGAILGGCVLYIVPQFLRLPDWRIPLGLNSLNAISVAEVWPLIYAVIIMGMARAQPQARHE